MYAHVFRARTSWLPAVATLMLAGATAVQIAAQSPPGDRHSPARAAYMRAHFNKALQLHDAVVRGHLDDARTQAAALADDSPAVTLPPGAEAFQGRVTQLARNASRARTLEEAGQTTAAILGTCGQCHRAMHARAAIPIAPDPKVGGLVGHMLLHQRGADALVEGLVGPSDSSWEEGVRTFAGATLDLDEVPSRLRKRMANAEVELAQLAGHAAQAHRTREREELYGRMLVTCGDCHSHYATHAGPGKR